MSASKVDQKSTARAPPPAFLFPNQQCQRPEPPPSLEKPAPPFSARCRRRRLSSEPRIPCQIVFFKTFRHHRQPTRRSSAEPAASKETTKSSQAIISKEIEAFLEAKYLEALANLFVFLGGRLLTKQNSRVNRPFHFCFPGGRSRFRAQKVTEARRLGAP